jgi:hypothetical protein
VQKCKGGKVQKREGGFETSKVAENCKKSIKADKISQNGEKALKNSAKA